MQHILKYAPEIHSNNVEKGFWENGSNHNQGERAMIIVGEISEAVDAHREGKSFVENDLGIISFGEWKKACNGTKSEYDAIWARYFERNVKDSWQDELADTAIRLMDFATGFGEVIYEREYRKETTGNFANDCLRLVHYCLCAFHHTPGKDWGYALAAIIEFCKWYNIDLEQHIIWKLRYNKTRPHKHGKEY